ncbi:MAG: GNAT family N-acetyltransferase [Candidatus Binatia bacterium]
MAPALAGRVSHGFRRARAEDLGAVNAIFHEAQTEGDASPPPLSADGLTIFPHELAHAELWVATEADEVVGFAATVERGGWRFLAELFVRRELRSRKLGKRLLERCFEDRGLPRMTMSSPDPRALALYVGLGLEPRWPLFYLVRDASPSPGLRPTSPQGGEVRDLEVERMDAEISGRKRPEDLEYWRTAGEAAFLHFPRGYAVVRNRSDDWIGNEDAITIGPCGGQTADDAIAAVLAAIDAVGGRRIRIGLPGPHPAFRALLERGFRIVELDTFLATPGPLPFDPTRYLPSGGALF